MFNVLTSTRINQQETEKGIYFQIGRVRGKTNEDTFEANTNFVTTKWHNSKKFGSGH